jgi:tRNA pseudouridine38-40 synthase
MPRYLVTLEYKGTDFRGFQKQPGMPTVQGALESAIVAFSGQEAHTLGAGRTDAGVHALGQVAAFDLDGEVDTGRASRGLNALLPDGIAVTGMREVPPRFDPRRDALSREYRYFILNRRAPSALLAEYAYHLHGSLDPERAARACSMIVGEHDFSAFRVKAEEGTTRRTVFECDLETMEMFPELLYVRVRAVSFLYRMVRLLVGAVMAVGTERMSLEEFEGHLGGGTRPCVDPLPAHGLFFWGVTYPEGSMGAGARHR